MRQLRLAFILLLAAIASGLSPANAAPRSSQKYLILSLSIPAPCAEVWKAFTTSDGLATWLAPNVTVNLKPGGDWLVHFPAGPSGQASTGGGTIVSFIPQRQLVLSALAPDRFPTVRSTRTQARFTFTPDGDTTVVTLTQTGWKSGPEWDAAYEYLLAGNAQLLAALHHRFVNGPIDWTKS